MKISRQNSKIKILSLFITGLILVLFFGTGCRKGENYELYHRFSNKSWERFNLLSFEIPIKKTGMYDVHLFARFTPDFQYEMLSFNMIMNTPAGEERIREYQMDVRSKTGDFINGCSGDSCEGSVLLKKELNISRPGVLKIEIENLTPRLLTEGILGVGVSVAASRK